MVYGVFLICYLVYLLGAVPVFTPAVSLGIVMGTSIGYPLDNSIIMVLGASVRSPLGD